MSNLKNLINYSKKNFFRNLCKIIQIAEKKILDLKNLIRKFNYYEKKSEKKKFFSIQKKIYRLEKKIRSLEKKLNTKK
ncbi:hypothetical protein [bacterium endosymbiont of Pedicinus badii]|uniref:hypothetical protein n=1 Tax=bacterium endosymbiont of Pedicinus badii TaxID=1719126 RepID=UPI0009BA573F|nr:hypothetical protein [bacterium endosymbiont of Pedicinus badii]OQM34165.1 hypothetical protein AOQ89_02390 [bacterium endosymbiont of Pedicinus badii]